jgi:hypothetical protein
MKHQHQDVKVAKCGLFLDKLNPTIGSSPDGIVRCTCCPDSCLEIKCPFSMRNTSPSNDNVKLPFLNGKLLKTTHQYYTQCQLQMCVTGTESCYFMVWTPHGHLLEKIPFNKTFCDDLKISLVEVYEMYLSSFILRFILFFNYSNKLRQWHSVMLWTESMFGGRATFQYKVFP